MRTAPASAARRFVLAALALWAGFADLALAAPNDSGSVAPREVLRLDVSAARLLRFRALAATVFVADASVADVQLPSSASVFVFGKSPGRTTFFALFSSGAVVQAYTLDVRFNEAGLAVRIKAEAGDLPVRLAYTPGGAVLSGDVPQRGRSRADREPGHFARNRQDLNRVLVSYRTFSQRWTF